MSGLADSTERPPVPELGEHTADVLADIGYTPTEIAEMVKRGIV
jgi:CoA:oxalate CoA-transferase